MLLRSNRGAARISAVWMISVGVLTLAALAFGFISQSDLSKERDQKEAASLAQQEAEGRFLEVNEDKRNISVVLGWYDAESADPVADSEAATRALEDLRATYTDLTDVDKDFQAALPKMVAAYTARGTEVSTLKTQISTLQTDVASANDSVRNITSAKDSEISGLRTQLSDEQANAQQRQQELEDRLASVQQQLADRDAELRALRATETETARAVAKEKRYDESRILNLSKDLAFRREPFIDLADGRIIDVSHKLGTAWIDIGANHRLTRGTRFRVEGGLAGRMKLKAWAEVTEVRADRAEIVLSDLQDKYDRVIAGDIVVNPIFDPLGMRNAVLAGNFSGTYSRTELESLLANMGIEIQPEIDHTTHFLIVGSKLYNDPETSEPLEEPMAPSELAVYKEAEARHVQIIPLADVRQFFRLGGQG